MNMKIKAHFWAVSISMIFLTVVTILGEMVLPFKDFLKVLTNWGPTIPGHHWATKSILVILVYVVSLFILNAAFKDDEYKEKSLYASIVVLVLCCLAMLLFFTGHQFHWF
jgi:hypothetical protein